MTLAILIALVCPLDPCHVFNANYLEAVYAEADAAFALIDPFDWDDDWMDWPVRYVDEHYPLASHICEHLGRNGWAQPLPTH